MAVARGSSTLVKGDLVSLSAPKKTVSHISCRSQLSVTSPPSQQWWGFPADEEEPRMALLFVS